jgi:ABC-type Mn2+/Zn2+ transport system permease subunit
VNDAAGLELLREPFVQDALKAALMVGVPCAFLGVFVVLKRIVFVGAALANAASLGAALAFSAPVAAAFAWLVAMAPALEPLAHFKPLVLALAGILLAVAFFSQHRFGRRVPREAIIGTAYAGAAGLTLVVLASVPSQREHAMDVLQGNVLGVEPQELVELAAAGGLIGVVQALFFKEFVLVSLDPEVARTLGFNASGWELLWYLSLGVMIAVSIHVAGTILVFAYLTIPPVTALLISRRLRGVLALSVLLAVAATVAGVVASVSLNLPVSPSIVTVAAGLFAVTWTARFALPRR